MKEIANISFTWWKHVSTTRESITPLCIQPVIHSTIRRQPSHPEFNHHSPFSHYHPALNVKTINCLSSLSAQSLYQGLSHDGQGSVLRGKCHNWTVQCKEKTFHLLAFWYHNGKKEHVLKLIWCSAMTQNITPAILLQNVLFQANVQKDYRKNKRLLVNF